MDVLTTKTVTLELVQGVSKKGTTYTAIRIGDSLIFDHRLVESVMLDYIKKGVNTSK